MENMKSKYCFSYEDYIEDHPEIDQKSAVAMKNVIEVTEDMMFLAVMTLLM